MVDYKKIRKYKDRIKGLNERLKGETDFKKKEIIKLRIGIEENRIKIEKLKY